ncbi:mediator of RNA polymerase II transcription subunit 1-like [Rhinophrynus dorsalis]
MKHPEKSLLQKLHLKFSQKPWTETMKLVRHCLEKPAGIALTSSVNHPVLKCKDTLQESLKAKSLSAVLTRIETISKQKGLESHLGPNGRICYITSEMFYIEVQVKKNGKISSVKLAHHGEAPTVCKELLHFLRTKDFEAFGRSLEGLLLLYNIPGNSETKAKVYTALQSLEADLSRMFSLCRPNTDEDRVAAMLQGRVGNLSPRSGGTPMSIEYYASPYQLLEEKLNPGTQVVGLKASVTVLGTNNWFCLPVLQLFNETQQTDVSNPVFSVLTEENSMNLPACFSLSFSDPVPVFLTLIQKVQTITGMPVVGTKQAPLHELLIQMKNESHRTEDVSREDQFIMSVPDCIDHCYTINSRTDNDGEVMGALVNKIPFTHPSHVPPTLEVLRHQAAYNTLISSCISSTRKTKECSDLLHFEVSLKKDCRICILFQHPRGESLCCVPVDVLSSRHVRCNLYTDNKDPSFPCNSEFIKKVMECCMSVPITMRAIFRKAQKVADVCKMEISSAISDQSLLPEIQPEDSTTLQHDEQHPMQTDLEKNAFVNTPHIAVYNGTSVDGNVGAHFGSSQEHCFGITPEQNPSVPVEMYMMDEPINYSIAKAPSSNMDQISSYSSNKEEHNSSIVEEPSPIMMEAEGPSPILLEETSLVMSEDQSSSMTEEHSSSITGELSSSITEELNLSLTGFMVPASIPE